METRSSSALQWRGGSRASSGVISPSKAPRGGAAGLLSPSPASSPDEDERKPAPGRKPGQSPRHTKCRVLLVEDDASSANALRVILTLRGCEVALAASLEQGLDLLGTNPTAIVVDLMLPDGDGIEILTRVREANLPITVAVTTAVGDPARLAAVHRLKPECVMQKPIDVGELLRAIGVA
ncbi:MAG TPA: response regulator [Tepidisphaeraceae bacterium]|nr:response regulator [Tepidisphaeraceae bacterium]